MKIIDFFRLRLRGPRPDVDGGLVRRDQLRAVVLEVVPQRASRMHTALGGGGWLNFPDFSRNLGKS